MAARYAHSPIRVSRMSKAAMVAAMGRPLVHAAAWALATSAAVTLSWFGVHTVLDSTEYDAPRTLPLSGKESTAAPGASSTQKPPEPSPTRASSTPSESRSSKPPRPTPPTRGQESSGPPYESSPPGAPRSAGDVRSASVPGGRAVFDMRDDYATLVSATPDGGWDTQVWKDTTWIRVTFSKDGTSSSIFCRWDDGPPRIETYPG